MIGLLPPARLIAAIVIALGALAGAWWLIDKNADLRIENLQLRDQIETMERMNDAERYLRGLGDGDILDWLHRRGK